MRAAAETAGQDLEIRLPLPLVTRVKPLSEASVFERPAIILAGRLSERAEVWMAPHVSGLPVKFPAETRLYFGVETVWVIRVNERSPLDPDLANIGFRFQVAPEHPAAWEPKIGALYVLLLDTPHYCCTTHITTHPQIGFEVSEEDRATPIIKGGEVGRLRWTHARGTGEESLRLVSRSSLTKVRKFLFHWPARFPARERRLRRPRILRSSRTHSRNT